MTMSKPDNSESRRRRVPRREFNRNIGVLFHGRFTVCQAFQIGEGGLLIAHPINLNIGDTVVVSFKLPNYIPDVVRAVVRYVLEAKGSTPARYGIEFLNLDFTVRRQIRNYVASQIERSKEVGDEDFAKNQSPINNIRRIRP